MLMRFHGSKIQKGQRYLGMTQIAGTEATLAGGLSAQRASSFMFGSGAGMVKTCSDGIVFQSILWPVQHDSVRLVVLTGWFRASRARAFLENEEAKRLFMT